MEAARLSEELRAGPRPASCRAGVALIRQENNIPTMQAIAIARTAWPSLCVPRAAAPPPPPPKPPPHNPFDRRYAPPFPLR
jgi:hypothetical protein